MGTDIHLPSFDLNLHTNTSKREINSDLYTITIMSSENVFLIWGGEGWVAGHLKTLLESQGKKVFTTTVRMQNREAVIAEIEKYKPTHILNAAGSTGRPNVDWCEDHKEETIRNNVIGTINLADVAYEKGVHVTVFATGCIYAYDETHPIGGPGYKETDFVCQSATTSTPGTLSPRLPSTIVSSISLTPTLF